jgi:DNA-directed RNA polymerase subunit RPC12/RpoP
MRMQRHFNSKHRYEYPCSICSSRFEDEMNAHVHEKVIHLKIYKDNTCTYCKSRLSDTKVLRKHLIS